MLLLAITVFDFWSFSGEGSVQRSWGPALPLHGAWSFPKSALLAWSTWAIAGPPERGGQWPRMESFPFLQSRITNPSWRVLKCTILHCKGKCIWTPALLDSGAPKSPSRALSIEQSPKISQRYIFFFITQPHSDDWQQKMY